MRAVVRVREGETRHTKHADPMGVYVVRQIKENKQTQYKHKTNNKTTKIITAQNKLGSTHPIQSLGRPKERTGTSEKMR